ncbi:MAG: hypothetical protein COT73_05210 [Bdellovibrio sp. CG10_big_fil_rev_8_21_14_0_10_47_8]|nr:MAG: hypothetical protein COT73_05210 [Bdellovibrio sp. CG10_big_fil_rev_8_21_14_0_10_47_8]
MIPFALLLMGNQQCKDPGTETRELRRRVQMGVIQAPPMPLTDGGNFDFKFAANAQLWDVLRKTQSFSTSTISSEAILDPGQMTQADRDAFNQCEDTTTDSFNQMVNGKVMTQTSTCMITMPQAVINGEIVNFELTTSAGVTVGLPQFAGLGVGLGIKKATLTMALQADHPLIPGHVIAASTPKAKRQEFNVNFSWAPSGVGLGFDFYSKTDLASVVKKAMENGISDLKQQFDLSEPWYATVLKNCDKALMINAGSASDANLQVGDILEVYNVWYDWEGEACNSTLTGTMKSTAAPIAVVQVEIVGDTFSQARVIQQTATKILPGARVYVQKLVQPVPATQAKN